MVLRPYDCSCAEFAEALRQPSFANLLCWLRLMLVDRISMMYLSAFTGRHDVLILVCCACTNHEPILDLNGSLSKSNNAVFWQAASVKLA